jgi:hypothetical protein
MTGSNPRATLLDRRLVDAHLGEPPDQVAAAISAGQAAMLADREKHLASRARQFFRDLRAGGARADHQHRAGRKLIGIGVAAGVHLDEAGGIVEQMRHERTLIRAGRDNDIFGLDRAGRCFRDKARRIVASAEPRHRDAAADRRRDEGGIGLDEIDDLSRCRKAVRLGVGKGKVRQSHRPVWKLKAQSVPTLAAPALGDPAALDHEMRQPALPEVVAHRKPRLTAADHQRLDAFSRRHGAAPSYLFCRARRAPPRHG